MPWLPFFADQEDAKILLDRLNLDDEIAFIVLDENQKLQQQRWKAVNAIDRFETGNYSLWHIPTGLPFLYGEASSPQPISDPWEGWLETRSIAITRPYFGSYEPAEIRLELRLRHQPYSEIERKTLPVLNAWWTQNFDFLAVSDFQFGSKRQKIPQPTKRWWRRLKAFFDREAISLAYPNQTFWAFPAAFQKLKGGMRYYANQFDLTEAIQVAAKSEH